MKMILGRILKDFTLDNTKKKTSLKGTENIFSVDYKPTNDSNILDIRRFLMKETK